MLIRWITGSHLCTAVGGQIFCKQSRKLQTRIMFENYYSFVHHCLLSCRYAMLQKSILNELKWGGTSSRLGGRRPLPHRSDGTAYQYKKGYLIGKFCKLTVKNNKAIVWTGAAKSNLNPKKSRLFCRTRENSVDSNLNQVRPACNSLSRRAPYPSYFCSHTTLWIYCKYNNVIPHGKPKIWFIQRSTAKQEVNHQLAKSISIN